MKQIILLIAIALATACGGEDGTATEGQNSSSNSSTANASTPNNGTSGECTPSAEVCDGVDNDCDGETDEDATDVQTFYADADEDGFGDDAVTVEACDAPEGYADQGGDCADDDAARNPGATEICDEVDNDCNDEVDETFMTLGDPCTEGLGVCESAGVIVCADDGTATCDAVAGEPTEMPESTCDGIDADCDGVVDNGCDDDQDGWCDEDFTVTTDTSECMAGTQVGDCNDEDELVNPGVLVGRCDGQDDDCDGETDEIEEADSGLATPEYEFPPGFSLELQADVNYQFANERLSGVLATPMDDGSWCIAATNRMSGVNYIVRHDPNGVLPTHVWTSGGGAFHVRDMAAIGNHCGALIGSDFAKRIYVMDVSTGAVEEIVAEQQMDQSQNRRAGLSAMVLNGVDTFVITLRISTTEIGYQTVPAAGTTADITAPVTISTFDGDGLSVSDYVNGALWVQIPQLDMNNTLQRRVYEVDVATGSVTARGQFSLASSDGWVGAFGWDGGSVRGMRMQQPDPIGSAFLNIQRWDGSAWVERFGRLYIDRFGPSDHLSATTWLVDPLNSPGTSEFWVVDSRRDAIAVHRNGRFEESLEHSGLNFVNGGNVQRHELIAGQNLGDVFQLLFVKKAVLSSNGTDLTSVVGVAEYSCF